MRMTTLAAGGLLLVLAAPLRAGETVIQLKDGPGRDLVVANCGMCHSLDYIQMNSVFLDRAGWQKSVDKMIKVMGAPVRPEDTAAIVDYLTSSYGVAPPPAP